MTDQSPAYQPCRWHPDAKQIGPVEVIHLGRYDGDPNAGKRETATFCMACMAESKPSNPTEFAS